MWNKLTAAAAFVMLISAAALDSEDWKKPLLIFLVSGAWVAVAVMKSYFTQEV